MSEQELVRLRQDIYDRDLSTGYARLYGPLAVVSVVLAFMPLMDEEDYGTIWDMAGRSGGDMAVLGILLMFGLIGCLGYATVRPVASAGLPVTITVLAVLIALMLIFKPGSGTPTPSLTHEGQAALAVAVVTGLLAVGHALHLRRRGRSS
jgi:hypothetical protein